MDKHLTKVEDIKTREEAEKLFSLADHIKANPKKYSRALDGKIVATLFYEPSTRTRLSFESAAQKLGAGIISTENAKEFSSAIKGESIEDTIRVIMGYADAIVMRHEQDESAERAAAVSTVPIICAGAGKGEHPTQALLDLYTLRDLKGQIDNLSIAMLGDLAHGRTINSLAKLLALYDKIKIYGYSPKGLEMPDETKKFIKDHGITYQECETFNEIPKHVAAIYSTRVQRERIKGCSLDDDESYKKFTRDYQIDQRKLWKFCAGTYVLHPLPRNDELSTDIDNDYRAKYFEQAHNGVPTRQALLLTLMGSGKHENVFQRGLKPINRIIDEFLDYAHQD